MSGLMNPTAFSIPGYDVPDAFPAQDASEVKAAPYAIAPVIWMFILLGVGYIGVRMLLED